MHRRPQAFHFHIFNTALAPPQQQFQLKDGVRRVPHYGLLLARVAGLPASVIDTASSITSRITEQVLQFGHTGL